MVRVNSGAQLESEPLAGSLDTKLAFERLPVSGWLARERQRASGQWPVGKGQSDRLVELARRQGEPIGRHWSPLVPLAGWLGWPPINQWAGVRALACARVRACLTSRLAEGEN